MDKLKITLSIFFSIVATLIITVLMWTCLYLTIPNIKNDTDKLFKWNDYAVTENIEIVEEESPIEVDNEELALIA